MSRELNPAQIWTQVPVASRTVTASGGSIASVSGAVGSVTGAVGSVTGAVGSVTGAVGSVTGAVGSVTGAVGSVTGAVGSVTGNVGGSVASVTGAVGSVTGNVSGSVASVVASVTATLSANGIKRQYQQLISYYYSGGATSTHDVTLSVTLTDYTKASAWFSTTPFVTGGSIKSVQLTSGTNIRIISSSPLDTMGVYGALNILESLS